MHLGTARFESGADADATQINPRFIAVMWVWIVTIAGIAGDVNSLFDWTVLAAVALFPRA
jgi:hypothetical protein